MTAITKEHNTTHSVCDVCVGPLWVSQSLMAAQYDTMVAIVTAENILLCLLVLVVRKRDMAAWHTSCYNH